MDCTVNLLHVDVITPLTPSKVSLNGNQSHRPNAQYHQNLLAMQNSYYMTVGSGILQKKHFPSLGMNLTDKMYLASIVPNGG